jgi:CheY-like chemotaxis protein
MPSSSPTVLVVEDEALILLNTVYELEAHGFVAIEAANAKLALAALESRPDITHLFSDIDLPGGTDGLQLAEVVRQRWPQITILLTSGHMLPGTVAVPEGAVFLPKPYRLADLRASISAGG